MCILHPIGGVNESSAKRWNATPAKRQNGAWIVVETLDANYLYRLYRDPALAERAIRKLKEERKISRQ